MCLTRQTPAAFVWNQTLRLRDIPEHCVAHLLVKWERWGCLLRETCEEFRLLLPDVEEIDEGPHHCPRIPTLEVSEAACVRDCETLVKLVRSLVRKVRVRCIVHLSEEHDAMVVDRLYPLGEVLASTCEELVAHLPPPHDATMIATLSAKITTRAVLLAEVASECCPQQHRKWFAVCAGHLDVLLMDIIGRSPIR